jgi:hypothetical protein
MVPSTSKQRSLTRWISIAIYETSKMDAMLPVSIIPAGDGIKVHIMDIIVIGVTSMDNQGVRSALQIGVDPMVSGFYKHIINS